MTKEYLLGLVAYFDEDVCAWQFDVQFLGPDGPFMEHDHEVYNQETGEWECAHMTAENGTVERANFVLLEEALEIAQDRFVNFEPSSNVGRTS